MAAHTRGLGSSGREYSEYPANIFSHWQITTRSDSHLICQLNLFLKFVVHCHGGSGPAVRNISHPGQVHVHNPGIQSCLPVVRDLVTGGVVVVETRGHGSHVLRGEIIKEWPEIFRRSGKIPISKFFRIEIRNYVLNWETKIFCWEI